MDKKPDSSARKIIHIDMDAFYASVEQRDFPEYKGKPLAVGGNRERGVVAAASYEARKFGVKSAMSSKLAYQKCPNIIFVKPRFEVYKSVSKEIRTIFEDFTDLVEPLALDEAFLDVTENKKGLLSATEIAKEIKRKIKEKTGLTASAGVSINKFLAKIASDYQKPNGLYVIPPSKALSFIENLQIEKFFGIGKVTATKLGMLGILKGRDLKKYNKEFLVRKLGKLGYYLYDLSLGLDTRPVNPNRIRKSLSVENTFEKDLENINELNDAIEDLAPLLLKRLEKGKAFGKTLTLKVKFGDFSQITRSKTVNFNFKALNDIILVAMELAKNIDLSVNTVRLIGIGISNFEQPTMATVKQLTIEF